MLNVHNNTLCAYLAHQFYIPKQHTNYFCVRRAAEQAVAGQTRLATDRQRTHEHRAAEQPEARQARLAWLERLRERNIKLKMLGFAQCDSRNAPAFLL